MTFAISFGKWGGFYIITGWTWRVCLGWMALTILPMDLDVLLGRLVGMEDDS